MIEGTTLSAEIEVNRQQLEGSEDYPIYWQGEGDVYKNTIRVDKVYRVKENVSNNTHRLKEE